MFQTNGVPRLPAIILKLFFQFKNAILLKGRFLIVFPAKGAFGFVLRNHWEISLKEIILQWGLVDLWTPESDDFTESESLDVSAAHI